LKANPKRAQALYLRGLIKLRRNDVPSGTTDIAEAKKIRAAIENEFRKLGIER